MKLEITEEEYEIARKAVEDELVWRRDECISVWRNNGLSIADRDGTRSTLVRMSTEDALAIALKAINASRGL